MNFAKQRILILGLGESGLAMAQWCASAQSLLGWDSRQEAPSDGAFVAQFGRAARLEGALDAQLLESIDLIALSPGLSPHYPPLAAFLSVAKQLGVAVWGEFEFFAQELAERASTGYRPKLIGITGTNGKTTVTSLCGHLCRRAGLNVQVAGNIGPPILRALKAALDHHTLPDVWVLELSSFQLESTHTLRLDAAALLNLTQDHLDWHGTIEAYGAAKLRIFRGARTRVINRDDDWVLKAASPAAKDVLADRATDRASPSAPSAVIRFGLDVPAEPGDFGLVEEAGLRWLAVCEPAEELAVATKRQISGRVPAMRVQRLMPVDALLLRGAHNQANVMAALALTRAIGLPLARVLHAVRDYRGEAHRVEAIASWHGIDFVDDSKGTNVGATVAALTGLGQTVVLIAGGEGKQQDFTPLAAPVARHARAVVLIGRDRDRLRTALAPLASAAQVVIEDAASLPEAVQRAVALAQPGDAVLLSPACASLDMFRHYVHRAEVFREAVREVMLQAGQPC